MAISDRDYYRKPRRDTPFGSMSAWNVTTWLIVINVAVFLLDPLMGRPLEAYGFFSFRWAIIHLQLWRFVTFQFFHANIEHIGFNMVALYFFGPMVEEYLGSRRYLAFYLLCGVAGAATYLVLMVLNIISDSPATHLIGASAGIFGVLIAAATSVAPDETVFVDFVFPIRLRMLAWIAVGIAVYTVVARGENAGGEAAHLGGAALGYYLIRNPRVLNFVDGWPRKRR